jgi:glutathione S-transferase
LADLHAFPMLRYLALAPEGRTTLAKFDRLQQWMQLMHGRPSIQRTMGPYERSE